MHKAFNMLIREQTHKSLRYLILISYPAIVTMFSCTGGIIFSHLHLQLPNYVLSCCAAPSACH